jgi:hypothetical protein
MRCRRCWGLVIVETSPFTYVCTEALQTARCVNCGWIEDPVMRTNRLTSSRRDEIIPAVAQSRRLSA